MATTDLKSGNLVGYIIGAAALGGVVFLVFWAAHKGWIKGAAA